MSARRSSEWSPGTEPRIFDCWISAAHSLRTSSGVELFFSHSFSQRERHWRRERRSSDSNTCKGATYTQSGLEVWSRSQLCVRDGLSSRYRSSTAVRKRGPVRITTALWLRNEGSLNMRSASSKNGWRGRHSSTELVTPKPVGSHREATCTPTVNTPEFCKGPKIRPLTYAKGQCTCSVFKIMRK